MLRNVINLQNINFSFKLINQSAKEGFYVLNWSSVRVFWYGKVSFQRGENIVNK